LIEALATSLPLILVAHLFGKSAAGLFFLVQRIVSLPATLVTTSIADVYHTRMAEHYRAAHEQLRPFLYRSVKQLLLLGTGLVVPFAILVALGFSRIFGSRWGQGGGLVIALVPWTLAALVVSPVSRVLLITQKLEYKLAYDIFALLSTCVALYTAQWLSLSLTSAVALLSAVRLVGYGLYFYVLVQAVGASIRYRDADNEVVFVDTPSSADDS